MTLDMHPTVTILQDAAVAAWDDKLGTPAWFKRQMTFFDRAAAALAAAGADPALVAYVREQGTVGG
ncbi:MAG: hypothetical protein GX652_09715 [Burkholderiaceae bacterium]|nr:hypothetical protein [Burkholderiaceae bacterium]